MDKTLNAIKLMRNFRKETNNPRGDQISSKLFQIDNKFPVFGKTCFKFLIFCCFSMHNIHILALVLQFGRWNTLHPCYWLSGIGWVGDFLLQWCIFALYMVVFNSFSLSRELGEAKSLGRIISVAGDTWLTAHNLLYDYNRYINKKEPLDLFFKAMR